MEQDEMKKRTCVLIRYGNSVRDFFTQSPTVLSKQK